MNKKDLEEIMKNDLTEKQIDEINTTDLTEEEIEALEERCDSLDPTLTREDVMELLKAQVRKTMHLQQQYNHLFSEDELTRLDSQRALKVTNGESVAIIMPVMFDEESEAHKLYTL